MEKKNKNQNIVENESLFGHSQHVLKWNTLKYIHTHTKKEKKKEHIHTHSHHTITIQRDTQNFFFGAQSVPAMYFKDSPIS